MQATFGGIIWPFGPFCDRQHKTIVLPSQLDNVGVTCPPRPEGAANEASEFITILGGAAASWPLTARAQEPPRVIGFLGSGSSDTFPGPLAAFVQGLKDTGFIEGKNISIECCWADSQYDRLPSLADGCTDPACDVTILLANPEPSKHGTERQSRVAKPTSVVRGIGDIASVVRKCRS
jgi:hypothetical protein